MVRGKIDALACNRNHRVRFPIFSFRSRLVLLAVILGALLALPAYASAASYVVNEGNNTAPEFGGCNSGPLEECSLSEAIDLANEAGAGSAITFDPALETIVTEGELPAIQASITIDGSAPDGDPGVEIIGTGEGKPARAFQVAAGEVTIEGLALVDFYEPIVVEGDLAAICGNYIGVELDGETAEPNEIGIYVAPAANETSIGAECAGGGNVISGNDWTGVLDEGGGTHIAENLIGVSASGAALPNGEFPAPSEPAGGLFLRGDDALIGGPGEGNTIADNVSQVEFPSGFEFGGGVIVDNGSTTIRGNSIFANQGRGIYFHEPFAFSPPIPTIGTVASAEGGSTTIDGTVSGLEPMQEVVVDLYANAACDEYVVGPTETIAAGEGETYLGSTIATSNVGGEVAFTATLPAQPEGTVLTATSTSEGELGISTSEFSGCAKAPKPTPKPPSPPPPGPEPEAEAPKPENGETVAVSPKAGTVYVKRPGKKKKKLKEGETIPVGSVIDATQGKVTLTSVNKAGEEQTAVFYGGVFLVTQHDGSGLVILKLRGGNFASCGKGGAGSSSLARGGRKGRRLWGSGHGKFRTEGNYGSATVRGTIWLTEDRCDGTFFKVKRGVVTIRDFTSNETFALPKGKTYFAQP